MNPPRSSFLHNVFNLACFKRKSKFKQFKFYILHKTFVVYNSIIHALTIRGCMTGKIGFGMPAQNDWNNKQSISKKNNGPSSQVYVKDKSLVQAQVGSIAHPVLESKPDSDCQKNRIVGKHQANNATHVDKKVDSIQSRILEKKHNENSHSESAFINESSRTQSVKEKVLLDTEKSKLAEYEKNISGCNEEKNLLTKDLEKLNEKLNTIKKSNEDLNKELLDAEASEDLDRMENLEIDFNDNSNEMRKVMTGIEEKFSSIKEMDGKLSELEAKLEESKNRIHLLEARLEESEARLEESETSLEEAQDELDDEAEIVEAKMEQLDSEKKAIHTLEHQEVEKSGEQLKIDVEEHVEHILTAVNSSTIEHSPEFIALKEMMKDKITRFHEERLNRFPQEVFNYLADAKNAWTKDGVTYVERRDGPDWQDEGVLELDQKDGSIKQMPVKFVRIDQKEWEKRKKNLDRSIGDYLLRNPHEIPKKAVKTETHQAAEKHISVDEIVQKEGREIIWPSFVDNLDAFQEWLEKFGFEQVKKFTLPLIDNFREKERMRAEKLEKLEEEQVREKTKHLEYDELKRELKKEFLKNMNALEFDLFKAFIKNEQIKPLTNIIPEIFETVEEAQIKEITEQISNDGNSTENKKFIHIFFSLIARKVQAVGVNALPGSNSISAIPVKKQGKQS